MGAAGEEDMSQRSDRIKRRREFTRAVVEADDYTCQNPNCERDAFFEERMTDSRVEAHHVLHKRPNAIQLDVVENGISLCPHCHSKAHTGYKYRGEYVCPRDFMAGLLEKLKDTVGPGRWRWGAVMDELQKRRRDG
jgi:hypothetical protein